MAKSTRARTPYTSRAVAPIAVATASAADIAAQAKRLDDARTALAEAGDSAAAAAVLLVAAVTEAEKIAADAAVETARLAVLAAQSELAGLVGLPKEQAVQIVPEKLAAAPREPKAEVVGKRPAAETKTSKAIRVDPIVLQGLHDGAQVHLDDIISSARILPAQGDIEIALAGLRVQATALDATFAVMTTVKAGIATEIATMAALIVAAPVVETVTVVAHVDSRWRVGRQFTKAATVFAPGELAADELELLKADPLLDVTESEAA